MRQGGGRTMTGAREEDILRVEEYSGARLPPWLRERLTVENGFALNDSAGTTGKSWTVLPVLDRVDRKRSKATAKDMVYFTSIARAVDRVSAPGFGEPEVGRPFPQNGIVVGIGWSNLERLALLPDPEDPSVFGLALYRQMQFSPIEPLGVRLDELAPDPESFDTGEVLPTFRYHPDPVATGAVGRSGKTCHFCNRRRGWTCRIDGGSQSVCPWCLADGTATAQFGAHYVGELADDVPREVCEEVSLRTPSYVTWQGEKWQTCCGDACAYLGPVGWDRLKDLPDAIAAIVADGWDEYVLPMLTADGEFSGYLFQCLHCGTHHAHADAS